jgi:cytochrome c553
MDMAPSRYGFLLRQLLRSTVALAALIATCSSLCAVEKSPAASEKPTFTAEQLAFFEKEVQPLIAAKCLKCHGGEAKVASEFFMTSRAALLRGGELGPAVDLAKPAASQLLQAVRYEGLEMPPSGKLKPEEVAVLTRWVNEGLPWPAHLEKEPAHAAPPKKKTISDDDRKYWAYQPVREPTLPSVQNRAWVRNPIDAFILAKLEEKGLAPSADADARTLLRRATYDLTGLPPTPEEVIAFTGNSSVIPSLHHSPTSSKVTESGSDGVMEKKYAGLLDQLLGSPHYGEKWGRHWLDLVRYAETHGYERDSAKPQAYRYRDYVIDSFNADKPYDLFLREQLAGDELATPTAASLAATGFYRLGIWDDEPADRELAVYDELDGIVSTASSVVLGMSIGCARCHDHKRDPVSQRDYYRLLAFFRDVVPMNRENLRRFSSAEDERTYAAQMRARGEREATAYAEVYAIEQKFLAAAERAKLNLGTLQDSDLTELTYRQYRDTWTTLPDFDSLKAESQGPVGTNLLSLAPASRAEAVGLVYEGRLKVPAAGEYTFEVTAAAGARLTVNGKRVVNAERAGRHTLTGQVTLPAGLVPLRFEYYNDVRKPMLNVAWSGPNVKRRSLSDAAAPAEQNDGNEWSYVTTTPDKAWTEPDFDDSNWLRGRAGFGTKGTPGSEIGTEWKTKNIYLRRKFRLLDVPPQLSLDVHHDEDVVIYLNGKKAFEQTGFLKKYERVTLSPEATALLQKGENTIAVSCKQNGGGQYIDVRFADEPTSLAGYMLAHGEKLLGSAEMARYQKATKELARVREEKIERPGVDLMCVRELGNKPTHILLRGLPQAKGDEVTAGVPEVLVPVGFQTPAPVASGESSGKRTALAAWLTDPHNPLTARVMVNRIWQYHFGRGLVATSNDFGRLGELPTHPELLDWLAAEFIRSGWSVKAMHRLIMTSSTYRQGNSEFGTRNSERENASDNPALRAPRSGLDADPDNRLHWRFPTRRLTAEEVRDSILAVCGDLDLRVGGPSVFPPIPQEVLAGQSRPGEGWRTSRGPDANRRSVYVYVKRALQLPILATYDQADTDASCAVRYVTTVPTQSLGTMNGEFMQGQAAALAARLEREAGDDVEQRIRRALWLTTQREPTPDETARDRAFLERAQSETKLNDADAWKLYCLLCLNTNEFFYVD